MKICFITDGGRQIGMGHVQQSTTLARELRAKADVTFLTKSDAIVLTAIQESGFEATGFRNDAEILDHLTTLDPDIIIFDKIDVEEKLAKDIRRTLKASLVIFTNLTKANKYADIAVIAGIGSELKNVTYTDSDTNTRYYYGPRYWVLRPEFHEYKSKGKISFSESKQVLVIFGGSDPSNLTSAVLEELLSMDRTLRIDAILGAHFSHGDSVNRVLERYVGTKTKVLVHKNTKNVPELMYKANLTIASPGLSAFESLCVGTPVIVMPQNDMQRTYRGFMRMLERCDLGKLAGMMEREDFTFPHERHIIEMEIGDGVQELIGEILNSAKK